MTTPRTALRSLLRTPGFTITAALTLALGIGLSTAVFSVANALLLRRMPVADQDNVVTLWGEPRDRSIAAFPLSLTQAREFTREQKSLAGVAYVAHEGAWPVAIRDGDNIVRLNRSLVSGNLFDVLGARAALGRALQPSDNVVGAMPVAVISTRAWHRMFGGDADVVGRRLELAEFGTTYSIVGVMPAGLEYPNDTDLWAPFVPARLKSDDDTVSYAAVDMVARLAPGATAGTARDELSAYFARRGTSPWLRELRGVALPLERVVLGDSRRAVLAFALAAGLLLLITCIDVANLLLVRGLARTREMAVRAAIGGTRSQLVTQLLAENLMLALVGGAIGVGVAAIALQAFVAFAPARLPLVSTVQLDAPALLGAMAITACAMLLFGLAPALATSRPDAQVALRSGSRETGSRGAARIRDVLVAAQVALAVVVLSAAALLGRSFANLRGADLAFDSSRLLVAELAIRYDRYPDGASQLPVIRQVLDAVRSVPGVTAASPAVAVPFSGVGGWDGRGATQGQSSEDAAKNPMFNMELVTPDYFRTFGLSVLRGRSFTDGDREGAERVIVVSESMARRYWPRAEAVGQRLRMGRRVEDEFTVVGVVPDTRYRDLRETRASVYFPLAQSFFPYAPTMLVVRTNGPPDAAIAAIRRAVIEATGMTLAHAAPFERYRAGPMAEPRFNAFLLGMFAFAALLLAAVGLLGTMATMVRQRTREIGIRMALGATARRVAQSVVGRGLAVAGAGAVVGVAGSLLANRLLSSLLFEVAPTDPATLGAVAVTVLGVAVVSTAAPARASARIDPAAALRAET